MKRIFWLAAFLINFCFAQQLFAQFLDPCKCLIEMPKNEYEQYLSFCRLQTDSSTIVYQINEVVLIDTNYSDYVYNPLKDKHEASIISIDTIKAFLINGIYREYYLTDTLKTEGFLTTIIDIDKKLTDTINITRFGNKSYGGYWAKLESKIEDLVYDELYKAGEWKYYYPNGILMEKGEFMVKKSRSIFYSDEECKGGPHVTMGFQTINGKDGIWRFYNEKGILEKKYVEVMDDDYHEYNEDIKMYNSKRRQIIIPPLK